MEEIAERMHFYREEYERKHGPMPPFTATHKEQETFDVIDWTYNHTARGNTGMMQWENPGAYRAIFSAQG